MTALELIARLEQLPPYAKVWAVEAKEVGIAWDAHKYTKDGARGIIPCEYTE